MPDSAEVVMQHHCPGCSLKVMSNSMANAALSIYVTFCQPISQKLPLTGGSEPPSNTWFLGPIQLISLKGISIKSTVFSRVHTCYQWID